MLAFLGFPFRLAARRPLGTLLAFALGVFVLMVIDVAAAAAGVDVVYGEDFSSADAIDYGLYLFASSVIGIACSAPAMVAGLQSEGVREKGLRISDFALVLIVTALFTALFAVPIPIAAVAASFQLGFVFVPLFNNGVPPEFAMAPLWIFVGLAVCALLHLYVRLWFAAPHSLRDGRLRFFSSWPLTRGRYGRVFVCALALLAVALGASFATGHAVLLLPVDQPITGWPQVLDPIFLAHSAILASGYIAASLYTGAAQAYVFAKSSPAAS